MKTTFDLNGAEWIARHLTGGGLRHIVGADPALDSPAQRTLRRALTDSPLLQLQAQTAAGAAGIALALARRQARLAVCLSGDDDFAAMLPALLAARAARSPLLLLCARAALPSRRQGDLAEAAAKQHLLARDADDLLTLLPEAVRVASAAPAGPVVLDVPLAALRQRLPRAPAPTAAMPPAFGQIAFPGEDGSQTPTGGPGALAQAPLRALIAAGEDPMAAACAAALAEPERPLICICDPRRGAAALQELPTLLSLAPAAKLLIAAPADTAPCVGAPRRKLGADTGECLRAWLAACGLASTRIAAGAAAAAQLRAFVAAAGAGAAFVDAAVLSAAGLPPMSAEAAGDARAAQTPHRARMAAALAPGASGRACVA